VTAATRLQDYVGHIMAAAKDALTFTEGLDQAEFMADLRTQRAVVMSLMIIGEAASRIVSDHPSFVTDHPGIPWRSIRGMRNRIAHGYFEIDLTVVWQTVQTELPGLVLRLGGSADRDGPDKA
jgi:uncharacterized protein with HEPN domain